MEGPDLLVLEGAEGASRKKSVRCTCTKKRNGLCSTMVRAAVYSTDGRFLYAIWRGRTRCLRDIELSHVFFLPFNVVKILKIFGDLNSRDMDPLQRTLGLHQPFC